MISSPISKDVARNHGIYHLDESKVLILIVIYFIFYIFKLAIKNTNIFKKLFVKNIYFQPNDNCLSQINSNNPDSSFNLV